MLKRLLFGLAFHLVLCVGAVCAEVASFTQIGSQALASAALSYTTSFLSTQGLYLAYVGLRFSSAPASSETVTVTLVSRNGASYNTVLAKTTTVAASTTTVTLLFNGGIPLNAGDQIKVTCTNVSAATTVSASVVADTVARQGYGISVVKNGDGVALGGGGGGSGSVTSVDATSATGLTFSGGPITTTGVLTLAGKLGIGNGGTNLTSATDDTVMLGNGTTWEAKAVGDCQDTSGKHINYTASSNTFTCGTSVSISPAYSLAGGTGVGTVPATATSYAPLHYYLAGGSSAEDAAVGTLVPVAATFSKLYCISSVAPGAAKSYAITVRHQSSSDSSLTCTISGSSAVSCNDVSNTAVTVAGDVWELKVVPASTPAAAAINCAVKGTV